MTSRLNALLIGLFCVCTLALTSRPAAASTVTFDVLVNTAPLIGNVNGPFSLDFQLNGAGPNTVSVTNFLFFGGSAVGSPSLFGGATGSLSAGVGLNDSGSFFNEFFQRFNPGSSLRFTVSLTTNLTATPDAFSFAILDGNLFNIPTNGLGDSLLLFNIHPNPIRSDLQGFRGLNAGAGADFSAVTAQAVPEPASMLLVVTGLLGFVARRRFDQRARRP